ncbi:MAG TPA: acyl-CoA dehydrogenase family protein [Stellaceae bacterium]|nr:acyl-CoA dehydrogenase family protein [Stellaceae bacterium]
MTTLPAFDLDPAVGAFRREIRDWLAINWHGEREAMHKKRPFKDRGWDPEFSRLVGRQGWIGLGWPKEFGGQARSPAEQLAFVEEMEYAHAPRSHLVGETIVGPALIRHGTKEQQAKYLPAILRGEMTFGLGYSEPEAGSDLAGLRTRAVRDGDDWVITGQKLWSTGGDKAEHVWLAVRTDPDAKPKHAGISVFIVSLRSPGITIRPSIAMYGKTFSATFYDDVRVPGDAMVGAVNNGWKVITDALASERVMIGGLVALLQHALDRLTDYVKHAEVGGRPLRNDAVIRDRIGALAADIEVARQFAIRNARLLEEGRTPLYEAAMTKVFAGELQERLGEAMLDILGTGGLLSEDASSAPIGEMEQVLRHAIMGVIGGGTAEIQRNVIAIRGLSLPR